MFQRKYHLRAIFRATALLCLIIGFSTYNFATRTYENNSLSERQGIYFNGANDVSIGETMDVPFSSHRKLSVLEETVNADSNSTGIPCSDLPTAKPEWMLAFYIIGVLYMFLALAIVCDEFFVPALEEMSSDRHLNLSPDVAGATLMAAGGSAPELFTSLVGTFQESAVGFGTIVGSAVFNVLFVIAMCSFLSKDVLTLTWWPLARDSIYYVISLTVLGVFVAVVSPGGMDWWESLILFGMYFGYVIVMKYSRQLYKIVTGKEYVDASDESPEIIEGDDQSTPFISRDSKQQDSKKSRGNYTRGRWPGTFRAGIIKLLREPESWNETACVGIVAQIAGDVDATLKTIDRNNDGYIDRDELKKCFELLGNELSPEDLETAFNSLDENNDGKISEKEFTEYYIRSEGILRDKVKKVFDDLDTNKSGSIDRQELEILLTSLEPGTTEADVDNAMKELQSDDNEEEISFEEFSKWYESSIFFEKKMASVKADMDGAFDHLKPPKNGTCFQYVTYIVYLPLLVTLTFTIPDVRRPGLGKWCYAAFIMAIVWIGLYSYFMVEWTTIIGNTFGIPDVVMGLTFLAAGTSVPDLLSSVIVARRGQGDMAVSSSLGSNIFDILVGLPVPWLLYAAYSQKTVMVGADGVAISLGILVGMVIAVITTIHFCGWKLNKAVGGIMILLYLAFLGQAVYRELPFTMCTP